MNVNSRRSLYPQNSTEAVDKKEVGIQKGLQCRSVGCVGGDPVISDSQLLFIKDERLLSDYKVTPKILMCGFCNVYRNVFNKLKSNAGKVSFVSVITGLSISSRYFGGSTLAYSCLNIVGNPVIIFGLPLIIACVSALNSWRKGELGLCQKALNISREQLNQVNIKSRLTRLAFSKSSHVLTEHNGFQPTVDNIERVGSYSSARSDFAARRVDYYENKIQRICFDASANGECNDEHPEGSDRTKKRIERLEGYQDKWHRKNQIENGISVYVRSFRNLLVTLQLIQEEREECLECVTDFIEDYDRLQEIRLKK